MAPVAWAARAARAARGMGGAGGAGGGGPAPDVHRAEATPCDDERSLQSYDPDPQNAECQTHDDCQAGRNGRCVGNGHDGWYCTYDECLADAECDNVCACENGFRSDHNVCIGGNCRVDADCGPGGFCSPSLGDCGHYDKFRGYWCRTTEDTCLNDADCDTAESPNGYCAWLPEEGHWGCSTAECVGK
ncbi:MAG: hypothetical protein R3F60_32040 [bacterium]